MVFIITGILTYASQANRDAALSRINTALGSYGYTNRTTAMGSGVGTSGTLSIIFSIQLNSTMPSNADAAANAIFNAASSSNRHTSGYIAVNQV